MGEKKPIEPERAKVLEETKCRERARVQEKPIGSERAISQEETMFCERAKVFEKTIISSQKKGETHRR